MKIFDSKTIHEIDEYTINNEPVSSINLMERAARKIFDEIKNKFSGRHFLVLAGPGNNGGDALALARMLLLEGFEVITILLKSNNLSPDASINKERLNQLKQANLYVWEENQQLPVLPDNIVIIDGLFGSGLNRPLDGSALNLVQQINKLKSEIVSIDIPSGLMSENNFGNNPEGIIKADFTYSFQFPKLVFLFPENQQYIGKWEILDIGLHEKIITETYTNRYITELHEVRSMFSHRNRFDHKGKFGHALLIAGSYGKTGAAILASKACLRSGAGLLTVQTPQKNYIAMQVSIPEAMINIDSSDFMFTECPDLNLFTAVAIGPGIGTHPNTKNAFSSLLDNIKNKPLVIDADAINILSQSPDMICKLPPNTILTPHPKEFERLVGKWNNDYQRLEKAVDFCTKRKVIMVLKGAFSTVILPDGTCFFNPTGNPGMATAGSGDVLTGIILGLLARGLTPEKAAISGVYIHGLAGDLANENIGEESLIASDIILYLSQAYKRIIYK